MISASDIQDREKIQINWEGEGEDFTFPTGKEYDFLSDNYPLNTLKIAGVDMEDKEVYESAIRMFDEAIEEYLKNNEEQLENKDGFE